MSRCACTITDERYDGNEYHISRIIKAPFDTQCIECGHLIQIGQKFEFVALKNFYGVHHKYHICLPCKEVRNCFCCSWTYGEVWESIHNSYDLELSALEGLSEEARDKFFKMSIHGNELEEK